MLKVKIPKLISAMVLLIIKRLLMVVISHLVPKDEVNVISKMNGWWSSTNHVEICTKDKD